MQKARLPSPTAKLQPNPFGDLSPPPGHQMDSQTARWRHRDGLSHEDTHPKPTAIKAVQVFSPECRSARPSPNEPLLFFRSHFLKMTSCSRPPLRRLASAAGKVPAESGEVKPKALAPAAAQGRFWGAIGRPAACAIGIAPPVQPPLPLPPTTAAAQMAAV